MASLIGLDIGASALKAVEIVKDTDKLILSHAKSTPTPEDTIVGGIVIDYSELTEQVSKLLNSGFTHTHVALAVKGMDALAKNIHIPYLNIEQLRRDLYFFADQYMNIEPEEYSLDYEIVEAGGGYAEVIIAAMRNDNLADFLSIINSENTKVIVADVEALALANLYKVLKLPAEGCSMIVQSGHSYTQFIFIEDGRYVYHELSDVAGKKQGKFLQEFADVPSESVENAKISPLGLPYAAAIERVMQEKYYPALLEECRNAISNLRLLGYSPPKNIYTSGAAALSLQKFSGFQDMLDGGSVEVMAPAKAIEIRSEAAEHILSERPAVLNAAIAMALQ